MTKFTVTFAALLVALFIGGTDRASATGALAYSQLPQIQSLIGANVTKVHSNCRRVRVCARRTRHCAHGHTGWHWTRGYQHYGWHCTRWHRSCVHWHWKRRCY